MRFLLIIIIFPFSSAIGQSPDSEKPNIQNDKNTHFSEDSLKNNGRLISPYVGYLYNWNGNHFLDIGIGFTKYQISGYHLFSSNISLSGELRFNKWNEIMYGPKVSIWFSGGAGGVVLGGSLINYRSVDAKTIILRPEVGLGIINLKWVYGYNIPIGDNDLLGLAKHNILIIIPFKYEE